MDESRYPTEHQWIERGHRAAEKRKTRRDTELNWIRWTDRSLFAKKARVGDIVVQLWGIDWRRPPQWAYPPANILHRQKEPSCTRLYIEESPKAEQRKLSIAEFRTLWNKSTNRKLAKHPAREMTDSELNCLYVMWPQM